MEEGMDLRGFVEVGIRLREMRQDRNLSMRALARASGLSTNALSMIERGLTSPSVSTLYKLADALEVPITAFFRIQTQRQNVIFLKAGGRRHTKLPLGLWTDLGGESFDGRIEPFMLKMDPGASSGDFDMTHTGYEFILCVDGQVEYEVDSQDYVMEPMDTLLFAAHLRHSWRNPTEQSATLIVVLSGFERSERPSEFHRQAG